jgi:hypothetical protein
MPVRHVILEINCEFILARRPNAYKLEKRKEEEECKLQIPHFTFFPLSLHSKYGARSTGSITLLYSLHVMVQDWLPLEEKNGRTFADVCH